MNPKLRTKVGEGIGVELFIQFPEVQSNKFTYLSDDEASGQTAISVTSGLGFAVSEYGYMGMVGAEKSEIVLLHSSTSPTASAITLAAATSFAHSRGDRFTFIPYNQIVIEKSTDGGSSYSSLTTVSLRVDSLETFYADTSGSSTDYYRVKFYNETDATSSDWSDGIIATGFVHNSVGAVKKRALEQTGNEIGGIITHEFLNDSLWECRRKIDRSLKRWSFRTAFDTDIGNIAEGAYSVSVPSTLRNPDSPQNILGLRIGNSGRQISYIDKGLFNRWYEGVPHTTVATQPAVGATTLVITTTRDLGSSGSIVIGSNTITYTAKTNSTNTLSGIPASGDGSIDDTHAVGVDVWQNASFGEPTTYTIFEDTIRFNIPFDSTYEGYNLYMDFYRTLPDYNSDADVLDEPDADLIVSYLKHKIKERKEKEKYDITKDSAFAEYTQSLSLMISKERISQTTEFVPDIGHLVGAE